MTWGSSLIKSDSDDVSGTDNMCYTLIGLPLIAYVSFYGMTWGDNANIKEQIGITSFSDLLAIIWFYRCIIVFCLYSETVLYNIPFGFKNICINDVHH